MSHIDMEYYRRRQADEQRRADTASQAEARRVHQEFADRYGALLQEDAPLSRATAR